MSKKRIVSLLLALAMLLSLCACGQTAGPEEVTDTQPADPVTVTDMIGRQVDVTPGEYTRVVCIGAGALRPQPVFPTVGPFLEVEEVVDKVGGNLHAAGKEGAQQGGCGLELSVAEGKGTAQQYRDDGSRQRLGAGGEKPCVG